MSGLLDKLPPFQGNQIVLVDEQDQGDIRKAILKRHKMFAPHYDCIAADFLGGDEYEISKRLFDFVKRSIPYEVESAAKQTVRSPAAILAMSEYWGADCKHYALFIGGVLDAIGRLTGNPIAWEYNFAGYNILDREGLGHVFVVVNPAAYSEDEIWIDPVLDGFNVRDPWPWYQMRERPTNNMALYQVSGIPGKIQTAIIAPRNSGQSCSSNGFGRCAIGDAPSSTEALNSVEPGLGDAVNQAISTLPDGDIKDFLNSFLKDPGSAIKTLIKGRTYTSGDYKLGEIFMRNILGMSNVQRWEQVPDQYVPQAWAFFTTAMGVRVRTMDDMDALCGYANTRQQRAQNYLARNPEETPDISLAAATRVAYLLGEPGYDGLYSIYQNRDVKWSMSVFGPTVPYVYPIPGVVQNGPLYSGVHPVTGQNIVNGYPADYTGPRYISQVSQVLQSPASYTAPGTATPGTTAPGTSTPGSSTKTSLMDIAGANPLATALLVGGGLYALTSGGKSKGGRRRSKGSRKRVSGMSKKGKTVAAVAAAAVVVYLLTRKKTSATEAVTPAATVLPGTVPSQIAPPSVQAPGPGNLAVLTPTPSAGPTGGNILNPVFIPSTPPDVVLQPPAPPVYAPADDTTMPQLYATDYVYPTGGGGGGGGIVQDQFAFDNEPDVQQSMFV